MRKFLPARPWLSRASILLLTAGVIGWAASNSGATPPSLWTESPAPAPAASTPWTAVAKADTRAVVNISTTQVVRNPLGPGEGNLGPGDPFQQFFRHFFGDVPRTFRTHSLGSGFIIRQDGYIVTNNHVVDQATEITVKLSDGRQFPATVVGRDSKTDLALVKIDARNLPTLTLGNSDALRVGEPVMAIGNPFGLERTVTTGIVSAKGRVIGQGPYDNFIQTDASINPGNSGGPLVNTAGQVVGVNTAIISGGGGSVGIGFAVPINEAKAVLPQLQAKGHVTRGWLGVTIQPVTPALAKAFHLGSGKGALVAQVIKDTPAAKAGLKAGDVIVEYNGHAITKESDLPRLVAATPPGREAAVKIVRKGHALTLTAQIAALPEPQQVAGPSSDRGKLGLSIQPLTPELAQRLGVKDQAGIAVVGVRQGSPAADAGIRPGDVIAEVNRQPVRTVADLRTALAARKAGQPTLFLIHRKGGSLFVAIEIEEHPQG
ncbi:MAG: DegQ family serine endoprotease [Candidatus Methylomirabilales bacterium]